MARKLELTFLDLEKVRTVGWMVNETAQYLGLLENEWKDHSYAKRQNLLVNLLDPTKYVTSIVWGVRETDAISKVPKQKTLRVFAKGYSIQDQINTAIEKVAGDGNDDIKITFHSLLPHIKFRHEFLGIEQSEADLYQTFLTNLDPKYLKTNNDKNFLTQHIEDPKFRDSLPILPSIRGDVLKAGYNLNLPVPDEPIY